MFEFIGKFYVFDEYTLTQDDIIQAATCYTLIILAVFVVGLISFRDQTRRLAWLISLLASSTTMVASMIYLINIAPKYPDFFFFGKNGRSVFYTVDNFGALVCLWFALTNIFDLVLGTIFYPKYMDFLTAYIHHPAFIWIMYSCTTGRVFYYEGAPYARAFMYMPVEELPTFLLALGAIFPSLRTDLGFGLTFFLLRILFHGYFFVYAVLSGADITLCILYFLTMSLHVFWFSNWIAKYGKQLVKGGGAGGKAGEGKEKKAVNGVNKENGKRL